MLLCDGIAMLIRLMSAAKPYTLYMFFIASLRVEKEGGKEGERGWKEGR